MDEFDPVPMIAYIVSAPEGLTKRGKEHVFRDLTVEKLGDIADFLADQASTELHEVVASWFPEGTSVQEGYESAENSISHAVNKSNKGVNIVFNMDAPHARFMTALKGGPQDVAFIAQPPGKLLQFYWKNPPPEVGPPGIYSYRSVVWKPARRPPGQDPIAETLNGYMSAFASAMLEANASAWVEFTGEHVQYVVGDVSRSPRVMGGR